MVKKRNKRGRITAWLVTWEWVGDHAKPSKKIAAVLNYRLTGKRVSEIIELIYANEFYTLEERVAVAKNKNKNPYRATYGEIDGVPWEGQIFCGHNPFLWARKVDNLHVKKTTSTQEEELEWEEREKPDGFVPPLII